MAATSIAVRMQVNQTNPAAIVRTSEVDVEHLPTDTQAVVEASALAYIKRFTDVRGVVPTRTATSYAHTTFTAGTTSMRRSTVTYTY